MSVEGDELKSRDINSFGDDKRAMLRHFEGILQTRLGNRGYTGKAASQHQTPVELSSKSEYALLALLELGRGFANGEPMQIRQIAAKQNIPDRYLEQLLATLRRAGFVNSQRGAKGGYLLARSPWQITLYDVVSCIEGFDVAKGPATAPQTSEAAVINEAWQASRQAAEAVLQKQTLQDLLDQCKAKQQVDLMYYI